MNRRILITGGFGFLGGRLAQLLASQSAYEILLGTRQQDEPPHWLPQAQVVRTQWDSPVSLQNICSDVDAVLHMAGMNAQDCAGDPVAALEFNGVATARLLQAAIRQRVKRFVYLSTAHVYSSSLIGVVTEETCPISLHPYATSHRAGEDVVRTAHQHGDIEGVVIRLSNAFGAPVHKDANCWMLLVNDLCRQAVMTRRMVLHSSGMQRRDFITLTDACRAIRHLLELPNNQLGDGLFNVGGSWSPTIWEMSLIFREYITTKLETDVQLSRLAGQELDTPWLDYRIDKLLGTGFKLNADHKGEMDLLLDFCISLSKCTATHDLNLR